MYHLDLSIELTCFICLVYKKAWFDESQTTPSVEVHVNEQLRYKEQPKKLLYHKEMNFEN